MSEYRSSKASYVGLRFYCIKMIPPDDADGFNTGCNGVSWKNLFPKKTHNAFAGIVWQYDFNANFC